MKLTKVLAAVVLAMVVGLSPAIAGTGSTSPNNAHGDNRAVNIWVAGFWLHHVRVGPLRLERERPLHLRRRRIGCTSCNRYSTTSVYSNTPTCVANQNKLTYAITGVCHQATNRALQGTSIPYVLSWNIGGGGTSNALFCTFGAGLSCYGALLSVHPII
ncbi:MAG: hypothetical protein IPL61_15835 [Myxococcales bacterium]|nr:hypothetical protein [Myxococcales bacterium]